MLKSNSRSRKAGKSGHARHISPLPEYTGRKEQTAMFSEYAAGVGYTEGLLTIADIKPEWTVLGVACPAGLFPVSLARKAKSTTFVDFSEDRLLTLRRQCLENGLPHITPILARMDDDPRSLDLGAHDAVIVSWPLLSSHVPAWITKLNTTARRRVYISAGVGDTPFDRRIFEATGRKLSTGPSFTSIYYNLLHHHLGVLPNIAFVREKRANGWGSREEALDAERWMFHNLTEEEEAKLRTYLDEHLIYEEGLWRLPYERECKWAVMWWEKEGGRSNRKRPVRRTMRAL